MTSEVKTGWKGDAGNREKGSPGLLKVHRPKSSSYLSGFVRLGSACNTQCSREFPLGQPASHSVPGNSLWVSLQHTVFPGERVSERERESLWVSLQHTVFPGIPFGSACITQCSREFPLGQPATHSVPGNSLWVSLQHTVFPGIPFGSACITQCSREFPLGQPASHSVPGNSLWVSLQHTVFPGSPFAQDITVFQGIPFAQDITDSVQGKSFG